MMPAKELKVFLAPGATDLRKAINGLSILVEEELEKNPFSGCLFAFCNRRRNTVKILYWDLNGFCLWMKRLEKEQFRWPHGASSSIQITQRELSWLLEGLQLQQEQAHQALNYSTIL